MKTTTCWSHSSYDGPMTVVFKTLPFLSTCRLLWSWLLLCYCMAVVVSDVCVYIHTHVLTYIYIYTYTYIYIYTYTRIHIHIGLQTKLLLTTICTIFAAFTTLPLLKFPPASLKPTPYIPNCYACTTTVLETVARCRFEESPKLLITKALYKH